MKKVLGLMTLMILSASLQSFATTELNYRITNLECKKLNSKDGMNPSDSFVTVPCDRKTVKRFKNPEVKFTIQDIYLFCVNGVCATRNGANEQNNYTTVNGGWATSYYPDGALDPRFHVPLCKIGNPKCRNSQITKFGVLKKKKDGTFSYQEGIETRTFDDLGIHSEIESNIFILKLEK